jgi:hypothetical protein
LYIFLLDEEINGEAMMALNDSDIEQLLSEKHTNKTVKKPTIGAKRTFETKLREWKKEAVRLVSSTPRTPEQQRLVLVLQSLLAYNN